MVQGVWKQDEHGWYDEMSSDKSPTVWKSHMTEGRSYKLNAGYLLWFLPEAHCLTNGTPLTCLGLFSDTMQCAHGFMCEDGETAGRWLATHPKQFLKAARREMRWRLENQQYPTHLNVDGLVLEFNELHE